MHSCEHDPVLVAKHLTVAVSTHDISHGNHRRRRGISIVAVQVNVDTLDSNRYEIYSNSNEYGALGSGKIKFSIYFSSQIIHCVSLCLCRAAYVLCGAIRFHSLCLDYCFMVVSN